MYWSWFQSTGADMRKYLTTVHGQSMAYSWPCRICLRATGRVGRTIVYLLQCDDRVRRQTLLRVLVQQKRLRCNSALLRRWHRRLLVVDWIHRVMKMRRGPSYTCATD